MTFEELGVREDLLKAIKEMGYETPMPVQEKVIPHLLNEDSDVVALAQTGTGKTAAFGLPVLQRIDVSRKVPQALIISPTRELCLQIGGDLADYSKYIDGLKVLPVYGGSSIESQIRALRGGVQIIVATPGRLLDLIKRGTVNLQDVHTVILDEADEMLNMGFVDDINDILTHVPEERKMLMFSATMPPEIAKIAARFMHNPQEYVIGTRNEGAENVRHIYYLVHARDKYLALKRIADYNPAIYGIIFCRTRRETQEIADKLIVDGYNADSLHGDLSHAGGHRRGCARPRCERPNPRNQLRPARRCGNLHTSQRAHRACRQDRCVGVDSALTRKRENQGYRKADRQAIRAA